MIVRALGATEYATTWHAMQRFADERDAKTEDELWLTEHPAIYTLGLAGRREHVLRDNGIPTVKVDRGGQVTYHGPGQLVAYPILGLTDRGLLIRPFVGALEAAMIATCAAHGVPAGRREGHPGCWCGAGGPEPRKIGALGLRVERGVSYHGIALNVTTDVADFDLIDPCGIPGLVSTSIAIERGGIGERPTTTSVERAAVEFARAFGIALGARIEGP